jgi:hypothetical protein
MSNEKIPASKELQDADAALRRAAQTAKKLSDQNGTPYVVVESKTTKQLQEHTAVENKQ